MDVSWTEGLKDTPLDPGYLALIIPSIIILWIIGKIIDDHNNKKK